MGIAAFTYVGFLGVAPQPTERGKWAGGALQMTSLLPLPTDPIGVLSLTLTNLVIGSAIQIESLSGVSLFNGEADASIKTLTLQVYSIGSPLNDLRIKVRKGSAAPFYQPWETFVTATVDTQSIYVSQISDE